MELEPDHRPSVDLLEAHHSFPGVFRFKAIGDVDGGFEGRVLAAVAGVIPAASDVDVSTRTTPGGRHVALTLDVSVQTAEQVREVYQRLRELPGLKLLL